MQKDAMRDFFESLADRLGLLPDAVLILQQVGASSPLALLSALEDSPDQFSRLLGESRYRAVLQELEGGLTKREQEERKRWSTGTASELSARFSLGAHLSPPEGRVGASVLPSFASTDLETRDLLFEEYRRLRALERPTTEERARRDELEVRLNRMLESP